MSIQKDLNELKAIHIKILLEEHTCIHTHFILGHLLMVCWRRESLHEAQMDS